MNSHNTDDIFKLSSGVGHHWRPGFYFPSHDKKAHVDLPLAENLKEIPKIGSNDHYLTTNQEYHNFKDNRDPLKHDPIYSKAPSLTKVNYLKEFRFVSNKRPWKRSLSPCNQRSETNEEFGVHPPLSQPMDLLGIKNFILHEYDAFDCDKGKLANKIEDKWEGGNVPPIDSELLRNLDPYLTTNQKIHRLWKPEEILGYPKKDILTHWDTSDVSMIPGTGLKQNPLPKDKVPRQRLPMRDELIFKSATSHRRAQRPLESVPHTGLKTLYQESYDGTKSGLAKVEFNCPVNTPWILPDPGNKVPMTAPLMYKTEYNVLGDCHRTLL